MSRQEELSSLFCHSGFITYSGKYSYYVLFGRILVCVEMMAQKEVICPFLDFLLKLRYFVVCYRYGVDANFSSK
jgi:hypothetical protein